MLMCGNFGGSGILLVTEGVPGYLGHEVFKFDVRVAGELQLFQGVRVKLF